MNDDPQLRPLFELGADQDDCVSASQLVGAGFSLDAIDSLVDRGVLKRVFHGVYVISAEALTDRQFKWAALLAAGPGSALSHFTAAAMHGLLPPNPSEVWVTAPDRRGERTITTKVPVAAIDAPGTVRIISAGA
jgi:predicted transcriptional regulator of viral defense system